LINNKQLILSLLTPKANSYANFKVIRSYVNSVFDLAEELEYIPSNKLRKTISRIKANKKILLKESKREEDLSLDKEELKKWLNICAVAVNDEIVNDINFALKEGDKISILPPVCGG